MSSEASNGRTGLEVAVVGMAARLPGARGLDDFWRNLREGVESVRFFSDEELRAAGVAPSVLADPAYVKANGVLDDAEMFDASFFGFSPREAELTDPQQRLFLECAWEALEHAGYDPERYKGRVGVFAGATISTYLFNLFSNPEVQQAADPLQLLIANDKDHVPTRVSYKLNLKGPSVNVQTACSTSLVAVHMAVQNLLGGECEMALGGGVSVHLPQLRGYQYQEGGPHSPDGHCRAFDARARGTVAASGVGVVVLKRLDDALRDGDTIHAVIKGSAINNDGAAKIGYTAPSIEGQAKVVRAAQIMAEVAPDTISYVEAHGTGTELGDPIEIAALTQAFRAGTDKKQFCAVGSVKTNIGHVDSAAGVTGLIKTVLALEHQLIPPTLHFERPNPKIDFADSPFYVADRLTEWRTNGRPRRAAVSSFGLGGTNAHVILEEAPRASSGDSARPVQLLLLSARTPEALDAATANLLRHFRQHPETNLADAAYTLQAGRKHFAHRRALVCESVADAVARLEAETYQDAHNAFQEAGDRPVVFMFPGGGNQYVGMGAQLYAVEPTFREHVDTCCEILKARAGYDLRPILYAAGAEAAEAAERLNQTRFALPAIFSTVYALARLLMSWGVRPRAMIGHSLGEYVAACLSGVLTLEDALALVELRAHLLRRLKGGAMLSVVLPEREVRALMGEGDTLSLAAINGPSHCVVSGPLEAIDEMASKLSAREAEYRRLLIDVAGHSAAVAPIMDELTSFARTLKPGAPAIPYLSNVTGTWITDEQTADPAYWARHLRQTVRFADGVAELLKDSDTVLLEVGPGQTLNSLVRIQTDEERAEDVLSTMPHPRNPQPDAAFLTDAVGKLWQAGVRVNWAQLAAHERRRRVPLPTYPFERSRYWIEPVAADADFAAPTRGPRVHGEASGLPAQGPGANGRGAETAPATRAKHKHARPALRTPFVAPGTPTEELIADIWQDLFSIRQVGVNDNFFELGGSSLLALRLNTRLEKTFQVKLTLHTLLQSPTVAALAPLIEATRPDGGATETPGESRQSSTLVEIRAGAGARPLVLVPPIGGGLYGYHYFAQELEAGPAIYGVQPPSLDGDGPAFGSIQDEAAFYLRALREAQPAGPYFLGGASYGGAVAFEMAQQLRAAREEVALLALFDTPCPTEVEAQPADDADLLAALLPVLTGGQITLDPDDLRQFGPEEQIDLAFEKIKMAGSLPPDVGLEQARPLLRLWKSNARALWSYRPQPYEGRVSYFRAGQRIPGQSAHPELPWIDLAAGGIEVHVVPGDHYSMLSPPHVRVLAEKLGRSLRAEAALRA